MISSKNTGLLMAATHIDNWRLPLEDVKEVAHALDDAVAGEGWLVGRGLS